MRVFISTTLAALLALASVGCGSSRDPTKDPHYKAGDPKTMASPLSMDPSKAGKGQRPPVPPVARP